MTLGLAMILRDEAHNITECLDPIIGMFDAVCIADTGSRDETVATLKRRFGIDPLRLAPDADHCGSMAGARNATYAGLETDWVLRLDADERLTPRDVERLEEATRSPDAPAGYLVPWHTAAPGATVEDYKLCLLRRGVRTCGVAHDNAQVYLRDHGLEAGWLPQVLLEHRPDLSRSEAKRRSYIQRLSCGLERHPDWFRYHWFLGYTLYRRGEVEQALPLLEAAAQARSRRFPVECLNAAAVLSEVRALRGERSACLRALDDAAAFHREVADDWEVRVNVRLGPWLESARAACAGGRLEAIRIYPFSY